MSSKKLLLPKGYISKLNLMETEHAIKFVKDIFEVELSTDLNLSRVSAPLFVRPETGLNDNLNGTERPVEFDVSDIKANVQIVQSLAKWKRLALKRYGFEVNSGLYTDMNAIRRDEELDNLHSIYVDQWDWEKIITLETRNILFLQTTVRGIVKAICAAQKKICDYYPQLEAFINDNVFFITTQELEDLYPDLTPSERENKICFEHKTVFIMQIGGALKSGKKHDGRAPDYDDWSLNGDIFIWYPILDRAVELSSMGIRVDAQSLKNQLKLADAEDRASLPFHKMILNNELSLTMGGGIGQSRLCMVLLQKAHVGEVQTSIWSDSDIEDCIKNGIVLL